MRQLHAMQPLSGTPQRGVPSSFGRSRVRRWLVKRHAELAHRHPDSGLDCTQGYAERRRNFHVRKLGKKSQLERFTLLRRQRVKRLPHRALLLAQHAGLVRKRSGAADLCVLGKR